MTNRTKCSLNGVHYFISAFVLVMLLIGNWSCEERPRQRSGGQKTVAAKQAAKDTTQQTDEMTKEAQKEAEKAQYMEACKSFLRTFYEEADQNYYDDDYVRSNIRKQRNISLTVMMSSASRTNVWLHGCSIRRVMWISAL